MKKILSVLMSFCTLFFMPIGKVNAEEIYDVLVICKDIKVFDEFNKNISKYCYNADYERLEEYNETKNGLICTRRGIVKKYARLTPVICTDSYTLSEYDKQFICSQLPKSCQVLIIYDLSDSSLDELIEKRSMIASEQWRELLKIPTFLNDCINLCITDEDVRNKWFGSLNFITYDSKNSLSEKEYIDKFLKVAEYTVALERKFKIDNKWGRSHQNYLSEDGAGSFFASIENKFARFDNFDSVRQMDFFNEQQLETLNELDKAKLELEGAKKKNYQMVVYQPQIQEEQGQIPTPTKEEFPVQEVQPNQQQNQNDWRIKHPKIYSVLHFFGWA